MEFSVLMSLYAKEKPEYLTAALDSLYNQTVRSQEVVLVEDGPLTDDLYNVIDKYKKLLNIKVVKLNENVGLAEALNRGLNECSNELVARMDTDDISLSHRFEMQVNYMINNPEIAASSGALAEFNDSGDICSFRTLPLLHDDLVKFGKMRSPLSHAVAIFRKSIILNVGGYPLFKRSQDVALWSLLIMKGYKLGNISDCVFHVRIGDDFMCRNGLPNYKYESDVIDYQYEIGYLNLIEKYRNKLIRFTLAIIPKNLKNKLYKYGKK